MLSPIFCGNFGLVIIFQVCFITPQEIIKSQFNNRPTLQLLPTAALEPPRESNNLHKHHYWVFTILRAMMDPTGEHSSPNNAQVDFRVYPLNQLHRVILCGMKV